MKREIEPLVRIETICEFLGGIPKKTIYKWTSESKINGIPYYKVGRFIMFRLSEIDDWIRKYGKSEGVR